MLKLNVYNDKNEIVKTCEGEFVEIKFKTIRALMKLLNIENISDTSELLNVVYKAWDELTHILSCCFKDMTEDDWDNVKTSEVIAVVIEIFKDTMVQFANIPNNSKN